MYDSQKLQKIISKSSKQYARNNKIKKSTSLYKNLVVFFTKQDAHTTYIARITYEQLMLQK